MDITLGQYEGEQVESLCDKIAQWCKSHPVAVGVAEMAVGAALITYAIQHGLIDESAKAISAINDPLFNNASTIGGAVGGGIGYLAGSIIGSIGIVALGGAIGIPATVVAGGAALIMGLAGYTAGDLLHNFLNAVDYPTVAVNGSLFLIGLGLLIDGARRCLSSEEIKAHYASFVNGTIRLCKLAAEVVASTASKLLDLTLGNIENVATDSLLAVGVGLPVAISVTAVGMPTVLGSTSLGAVAVSLGIIVPAVLPVAICAVCAGLLAVTIKRTFF